MLCRISAQTLNLLNQLPQAFQMGGAEDAGEDGKEQKEKVCVFGSGSFGTAMACVAARNGHDVRMLTRRQSVADEVNSASRNPSHLSDVSLPKNIRATTSPADALASARFVIHCIPVQVRTSTFSNLAEPSQLVHGCSACLITHTLVWMCAASRVLRNSLMAVACFLPSLMIVASSVAQKA